MLEFVKIACVAGVYAVAAYTILFTGLIVIFVVADIVFRHIPY